MSKILSDIVQNKISLDECLQRLLVIANRTHNNDLSLWCMKELNGYEKDDELPPYRKFHSSELLYSGINGSYEVTNSPLSHGFLNSDTISKISDIYLFEDIRKITQKMDITEMMYIDRTFLASEVLKNSFDGLQGIRCTSIKQPISPDFYSSVYSAVKTRVINLLCTYNDSKIDIDKVDVSSIPGHIDFKVQNHKLYQTIIVNGEIYKIEKREFKVLWNILVPIITAVGSGVLVYLFTNVWLK